MLFEQLQAKDLIIFDAPFCALLVLDLKADQRKYGVLVVDTDKSNIDNFNRFISAGAYESLTRGVWNVYRNGQLVTWE